ncbi:MAG: ribosomal-protein-alanine N-acetyltransferase [SAR202 cluster bacterium]|nr:ribosomal-protein-alanine N-acetyltransferase [Chloroflexota bacterium]MQG88830.1 ribosomal-protein-alanine N-acetyltransferase [SAR202 cluster bacterium]|tara:strand:+ start:192 stop:974 length:783 start_codon:yes stop_codon:yes gene_type:complete
MNRSDPDGVLSDPFESNIDVSHKVTSKNEFSIRQADRDDVQMLESIEREAFQGTSTFVRIDRDLVRENAVYLAAVRDWLPEERELGRRYSISTQSQKAYDSLLARIKRNFYRNFLDKVTKPKLPGDYIAGFIGLWFVLDETHVVMIALRDKDRRKGIGEQLIISALEHAVARGARIVTLEVRQSNEPAIELYLKYGFHKVGLRRRYYDDGENAVIMTTPQIQSDDFQRQFTRLLEQHSYRWGWVPRPEFGAPKSDSNEVV